MTVQLYENQLERLGDFKADRLSPELLGQLKQLSKKVRRDALSMVANARSGHIGGSFSSADIYLMLWLCANISPEMCYDDDRDHIIVSHGHTSPALYSVLGNLGYFDIEEPLNNFRKAGADYEGHPSIKVPGVEWGSGSLGQGLSVACGFAIAARIRKMRKNVFVVMGDGEQQKGQLMEAAEFSVKHKLNRLTAIIDHNRLQASGPVNEIMPVDIAARYRAAGWEIRRVDGHDFEQLYHVLRYASGPKEKPLLIIADTVMSKGIAAIENKFEYHGRLLTSQEHQQAMLDLEGDDKFFKNVIEKKAASPSSKIIAVHPGTSVQYHPSKPVECRTAAGAALYDIVSNNPDSPIAVVDCDLAESVKTSGIMEHFPERFIQCGIQEHNAATVAGALSRAGVITFFLDFGVFGIDETYGQHRMNDVNSTSLKVIATHCGLDVGEDGKTHQCLDYISTVANLQSYKLIVPADANQTDHVVRYVATTDGNFIVAMGRSKVPVISSGDKPFFDDSYVFSYGSSEWLRTGSDTTVVTMGTMVHKALRAADILAAEGIRIGVLNVSCPLDIDISDIETACKSKLVITYEDHFVQCGLGCQVATIIAENNFHVAFRRMGVTKHGTSGSSQEQFLLQKLDELSLAEAIRSFRLQPASQQ